MSVLEMKRFFKAIFKKPKIVIEKFIPTNDLVTEPGDSSYRSTGIDPQLLIIENIQSHFFKVCFKGMIETDHPCSWVQLYYEDQTGLSEKNSIRYLIGSPNVEFEKIIFAANPIHAFRLDPLNAPGTIRIDEVSLQELSTISVIFSSLISKIKTLAKKGKLLLAIKIGLNYILERQYFELFKKIVSDNNREFDHYDIWQIEHAKTPEMLAELKAESAQWHNPPLISILMPTYKSNLYFLKLAIESVLSQTYQNWQLCIADDGSQNQKLTDFIAEYTKRDSRIKAVYLPQNRGISAASNAALELAEGQYVALFDHDDELAPHALHSFAQKIIAEPHLDWIYSDEDKISPSGYRYGPFFKPDWSPEFMLSCMYTCHLGVYRTSIMRALGGFRSKYDNAQDYDLALRFATATKNVGHIPDVLYHWRSHEDSTASGGDAKPTAERIARQAVQDFIKRSPYKGDILPGPIPGTHRPCFKIKGQPLVSIVIPSAGYKTEGKGQSWYVLDLIQSIFKKSTYKNFEIIIVDNDDFAPKLKSKLAPYNIHYVKYTNTIFNIAEKLNMGVEAARGEYTILLNDDMTIITPEWIEEMLMYCQQDGIAAVGAKLLFPDDRVQHAGVLILGQGPSHPYYLAHDQDAGLVGSAILVRNYMAVTGACLMVRRQDYLDVGGFDPAFRVNYNDVDFCLKLYEQKGRIVYTPYAKLYHYESVSKGSSSSSELPEFNAKWAKYVGNDPYYNVNYSQSVVNQPQIIGNRFI